MLQQHPASLQPLLRTAQACCSSLFQLYMHQMYTCTIQVTKAALSLSKSINDRRKARGLQPRPVRAAVIGFPNVGKSALINRFLNRRVCESAPKPGVTKSLRWLRVGGDLDLLDAPGELDVMAKVCFSHGHHLAHLLSCLHAVASSWEAALLDEMISFLPIPQHLCLTDASQPAASCIKA